MTSLPPSVALQARSGWLWLAAAMVPAGALHAIALAWPGASPVLGMIPGQSLWWLQLVSLALLCAALLRAPHGRAGAALGGIFATSWLVATFWWLFISMHTYGGLAAPLAAAGVLALALFLGLYYAAVCACFTAFRPTQPARAALFFTCLWLAAELARARWWTGFPWGAAGYAHVDGPLAPLARWIGVYGLGASAAALAMGLALLQQRPALLRHSRTWVAAGAVAGLLIGAHLQRQQVWAQLQAQAATQAPLSVALLQGNIPQDEKFQPSSGLPLALQWYAEQLLASEAQLVVAPETALPLLPQQLPHGYLEQLQARFADTGGQQAALVGIPLGNHQQGYTNSALGWSPAHADAPYRYDKHHLVPFGEFIPPLFRWFTELMNIPLGDFNRGSAQQAPMAWAGQRLAPNICYEDLFGEELARRFADAQQAPTVFVNLSNIAWFGDSVAIDQHLNIGRMRALELERPMVRATNTGATALIDHRGQVLQRLPSAQRGVLQGHIHGMTHTTPYARWVAHTGLWPLWALALLPAGWLVWQQRRTRRGHAASARS